MKMNNDKMELMLMSMAAIVAGLVLGALIAQATHIPVLLQTLGDSKPGLVSVYQPKPASGCNVA